MVASRRPTAQQRRLRAELVRLRDARGLSREQVAEAIGSTELTIYRYETGRSRPKPTDVAAMLDLYELSDAEREALIQAAKDSRSRRVGWWHRHRQALKPGYDSYLPLEDEAKVLRTYEAQVVPGIFQTERYARCVIEATEVDHPSVDLDEKITVRLGRQRRLSDPEEPMQVIAVLDEAVLRREVGGSDVMREQLEYLTRLAGLDTVTIRVLPFGAGAHAAMDGPFHLLGFGSDDPDVVYLEQAGSGLVPEDPYEIRRYTLMFGNLTANSLSPAGSAALIAEIAREHEGTVEGTRDERVRRA